eukprot:5275523-Prorocentrum_lima.AAC.1
MVALRVHLSAWGRRLEQKLVVKPGMVEACLPEGLLAAFGAVEAAVSVPTMQAECPTVGEGDLGAIGSLP